MPADDLVQVDHLRAQDLLAAEREQLARQRRRAIGRARDLLGAVARRVGARVEVASASARRSR